MIKPSEDNSCMTTFTVFSRCSYNYSLLINNRLDMYQSLDLQLIIGYIVLIIGYIIFVNTHGALQKPNGKH